MAQRASRVRQPLHYVLGTRAKVGALRVLSAGGAPITQREVARRSGLQHRSAQVALDTLVALGIVRRTQGGRDFLVSLNSQHQLALSLRELFRVEAACFADLRHALLDVLGQSVSRRALRGAVLFGSVARGNDLPGSDVDLLLIAADEAARDAVLDAIRGRGDVLWARFGVRVSPIAYTLPDARRRRQKGLAPLPHILRDHVPLLGPPLTDLLRGED